MVKQPSNKWKQMTAILVVKDYKREQTMGGGQNWYEKNCRETKSANKDMLAPIYRRSDRNTEIRFPLRLEGECSRVKEWAPRKSDLGRHPEDE